MRLRAQRGQNLQMELCGASAAADARAAYSGACACAVGTLAVHRAGSTASESQGRRQPGAHASMCLQAATITACLHAGGPQAHNRLRPGLLCKQQLAWQFEAVPCREALYKRTHTQLAQATLQALEPKPQRHHFKRAAGAPEELPRNCQGGRRLPGAGRSIEEQVRQLRVRQASRDCRVQRAVPLLDKRAGSAVVIKRCMCVTQTSSLAGGQGARHTVRS